MNKRKPHIKTIGQLLENYNRSIYDVDIHLLISVDMADYIIAKTIATGKNRSETIRELIRTGIRTDQNSP
ncbi:hypothetical protein [Methanorbis rubei]|uniref:Uncharacterized protein n=1 Tax=Methanorbis rubei TaxID=3028300 RepID=A0AAE4MDF8_9EURY|nr:hypothetical protein [Methanocorpusculaceae archaeon Cs1]